MKKTNGATDWQVAMTADSYDVSFPGEKSKGFNDAMKVKEY